MHYNNLRQAERMKTIKNKLLILTPLIMSFPAVMIGSLGMFYNDIAKFIWLQNIAFLILFNIISFIIILSKNTYIKNSTWFLLIIFALLISTFIDSGMEGVHRWISIGSLRINVSMALLPLTILFLHEFLKIKEWWISNVITILICIILFIQPDASQLTSFGIPMLIVLNRTTANKIFKLFTILIVTILIIISWILLDSLPPVIYVEQIITLVANMGMIWLFFSIISLILIPLPFLLFPPSDLKIISMCIGVYYLLTFMSTFIGNFPIPLMGYGVSPMIGYFTVITWYTIKKRTVEYNPTKRINSKRS